MSRFELYQDTRSEWRWRFIASNGKTIAVASEGYHSEADCLNGLRLLKEDGPAAPVNRVEAATMR